jgi:predicted RNase H-like HicB family nuclease
MSSEGVGMGKVTIRADYDADARVWCVADSDLPGVHAEGTTLDELRNRLPAVVRDLVEANEESDSLIEIVARRRCSSPPSALVGLWPSGLMDQ